VLRLSNYTGTAAGRTFPSETGFHTSRTFFTDDDGVYILEPRDGSAALERNNDGALAIEEVLNAVRTDVHKIADGRLQLPAEVPFVEAHNTWVTNQPNTLLVIPVTDLAQHTLLGLCYFLQNGFVLYDNVAGRAIPEIERFAP